jgi:hypothetical protein
MVVLVARTPFRLLAMATLLIGWLVAASSPSLAQEPGSTSAAEARCSVDLSLPGIMKDIVSNALMHGLKRAEADVSAFLTNAETKYASGQDLLRAAAAHFAIDEARLTAEVDRFRHCNCHHDAVEVSAFARDVTLHVVLHELGHALIREFDLPVLGNEETMADAFATHFLTTHLPDRAADVLRARTTSLMIEAREVPREQWTVRGEHDNDGTSSLPDRRARGRCRRCEIRGRRQGRRDVRTGDPESEGLRRRDPPILAPHARAVVDAAGRAVERGARRVRSRERVGRQGGSRRSRGRARADRDPLRLAFAGHRALRGR